MGLLECASYMSIFRGYDYYTGKTVHKLIQVSQDQYSAEVIGTAAAPYEVIIDLSHPRKSKCNCPHANGRRIVCKHMLAVYFTVFPDEAQRIYNTLIANEYEDDEWIEYDDDEEDEDDEWVEDDVEDDEDDDEGSRRVIEYICKMKKSELQQALLQVLFDGPEWQYDHFIAVHNIPLE